MKRAVLLWVTAALAWSVSCAADAQHPIVLRAQSLIDGTSAPPRRRVDIVIRGNRIVEVSETGSRPVPEGADVVDLGSLTVLPGLIDTHTHIFLQGEDPTQAVTMSNCSSSRRHTGWPAPSFPRGARSSRDSRPFATWRPKVRVTGTLASNRPSKSVWCRAPGCGSRRFRSRRPAVIRSRAMRRKLRCPRDRNASTVRSRLGRPPVNSWTTAPTGSKCT